MLRYFLHEQFITSKLLTELGIVEADPKKFIKSQKERGATAIGKAFIVVAEASTLEGYQQYKSIVERVIPSPCLKMNENIFCVENKKWKETWT